MCKIFFPENKDYKKKCTKIFLSNNDNLWNKYSPLKTNAFNINGKKGWVTSKVVSNFNWVFHIIYVIWKVQWGLFRKYSHFIVGILIWTSLKDVHFSFWLLPKYIKYNYSWNVFPEIQKIINFSITEKLKYIFLSV